MAVAGAGACGGARGSSGVVGKLQLVPSLVFELLGNAEILAGSYLLPAGSQLELRDGTRHQQHPVPLRLEVAKPSARW